MAKFCGKCGAPLPEGSDICERCALKGKKPDIEIVRQTPNLKNAQKAIKDLSVIKLAYMRKI